MSFFKDFISTPEEVAAKATLCELKNKSSLSKTDKERREQALHFTRRRFLRHSLALAGGVATLGALSAVGYTRWEAAREESVEANFFASLEGLPIPQRVARIDDFYSQRLLTPEIARDKVIPIWLTHYAQATNSSLDIASLSSGLELQGVKTSDNGDSGQVDVNYVEQTIEKPKLDFGNFPSDKFKNHHGEQAPGIVFNRSILTHEVIHYDSAFRDIGEFADKLKALSLLGDPMPNPIKSLGIGFGVIFINANKYTTQRYFLQFDEAVVDVISSHVGDKAGVRTALAYESAIYLKGFLKWIGYDLDRLALLHRTSDFESFLRDIGRKSYDLRKLPAPNPDAELIAGSDFIRYFHPQGVEAVEALFPGYTKLVHSIPKKFIN